MRFGRGALFVSSLFALASSAAAQDIQTIRFNIAFYGAACLMSSDQIPPLFSDTADFITTQTVADDSGLPVDVIRAWADARAAEYRFATDALYGMNDDTLTTSPPEPFLSILRDAQNDCQIIHQAYNQRDFAINRLDATGEDAPPFDANDILQRYDDLAERVRIDRLASAIKHRQEAVDAGFEKELHGLVAQLAHAPLSLNSLGRYVDRDQARTLAEDLIHRSAALPPLAPANME